MPKLQCIKGEVHYFWFIIIYDKEDLRQEQKRAGHDLLILCLCNYYKEACDSFGISPAAIHLYRILSMTLTQVSWGPFSSWNNSGVDRPLLSAYKDTKLSPFMADELSTERTKTSLIYGIIVLTANKFSCSLSDLLPSCPHVINYQLGKSNTLM